MSTSASDLRSNSQAVNAPVTRFMSRNIQANSPFIDPRAGIPRSNEPWLRWLLPALRSHDSERWERIKVLREKASLVQLKHYAAEHQRLIQKMVYEHITPFPDDQWTIYIHLATDRCVVN